MKKIFYVKENSIVIYRTKYNAYWGENIKVFKAADFIAKLTLHIPPKHKHLIRYYGLYSSRTKGKAIEDGSLTKFGYRSKNAEDVKHEQSPEGNTETASNKASRQSRARLIQKIYEVDPLVCPKCSHKMRIVAFITDPSEVSKILGYLKRNHASPFDKVITKAS